MGKKFNWRNFISLGLLLTFLVMAFSGIILYIAPEGSIARWIDWKVLGLNKNDWEAQHTLFSYLFFVIAVLHIFRINWGLLLTYFKMGLGKFKPSMEIIIAIIFVLILFFGTAGQFKAFTWVYDEGDLISDSWKNNSGIPVEEAEQISFAEFVKDVFHVKSDEVLENLVKQGIVVESESQLFYEIAEQNNLSPFELYEEIKKTLQK